MTPETVYKLGKLPHAAYISGMGQLDDKEEIILLRALPVPAVCEKPKTDSRP